jgi:hypothetical protein
VRVRGVNLYVYGASIAGFWNGTLQVPQKASISYKGGGTQSLDQSSFPRLRLGRVGQRSDILYKETYGVSSLRNASPIGQWQMTLGKTSTGGTIPLQIADIDLDLDLVVSQ